jgi:hypothetical protein
MNARVRAAELELMEKLASIESDEPAASQPQVKTASAEPAHPAMRAEKIASLVKMARRAGVARAEADLAAYFSR